ncbi:universal stress protein [Cryomorphaceae bacterium 1068]|nr:universal stress protein [Cryomorphaceae bacterium 1068]
MKKILVPTDFSEGAFNALIHAIHAADILNNSLEIIHAYSMPATGSNVMVDITDVLKKNAEEEMEILQKRVEDLEIAKNVEINFDTAYGSVVDVINRRASEDNVSVVLMGTQGASGITEKWLGSNTAAAARNVNVPLLAIPAERPYKEMERILFSTDMKVMEDAGCMEFVAKLAKMTKSEVKFLHVRKAEEQVDEEGYKKQVEAYFDDVNPTFSFVYNENIEAGIEETIKKEDPSLLVVVRHDYGFFQSIWHSSVSRHIINNASLPILVLND